MRNPRAIALAAHDDPRRRRATRSTRELLNKKSQFVYVAALRRPGQGRGCFLEKGFAGVGSYPGGARAPIRRTRSPRRCSATRASTTRGSAGSSSQYNKQLAGRPGKQTVVRDPTGRAIDVISSPPGAGGRERLLDDRPHDPGAGRAGAATRRSSQWGAKDATAIVLDPTTGEVLAMAQTPGYNANDTSNVASPALLRNRAVTDTYEPGSTFKLVTITGALSEGLVTPTTRFTLPYQLQYGPCDQCTVHDAELRGRPSTTRSRRSSRTPRTSAR